MAKLKAPLIAFHVSKSLANLITFQKRGSGTIARSKPHPGTFVTLPIQYQRWLYQDYIALWNSLTPAQKAIWKAQATPLNRTPLAHFMSYYLTNLPDIVAMYYLDAIASGKAIDTSRNNNDGTVVGASVTSGIIGHALNFNGTSNLVQLPILQVAKTYTIECFFRTTTSHTAWNRLVSTYDGVPIRSIDLDFFTNNRPQLFDRDSGGIITLSSNVPNLNDGKFHHVAATRNINAFKISIDGILRNSVTATNFGTLPTVGWAIAAHKWPAPTAFFKGDIDHVIIWTRPLSQPTILRHANRRFPP